MSSVDASASTSAHAHHKSTSRPSSSGIQDNSGIPPSSNWFFRASSAGSPHARAGGRSGAGGSSSQAQSYGSHSREHESRSRSRSRVAGNQVVNGSNTDLNTPHAPSTPSKLIKRKSLGFVQLRMGLGGGGGIVNGASSSVVDQGRAREQTPSTMDSPRKGKAVYEGLGLGRAATPAASTGSGSRAGGEEGDVDVGEPRPRRKSLSRLLGDRPKEIDSGDSSSRQVQPLQPKEKEGSRGFMGSVRRISLVGRHRRSKSGGTGLTLSNLSEGQQLAPPLPISVTTPVLPPLPTSTSQLSLRLPSSSSNSHPTMYVGGSRHGSMHDLPSSMRMTSVASSQSQGSSIIPASSVSAGSSRRASSIHHDLPNQQTPTVSRRRGASRSSARSRTSEDGTGPKRRSSASRSTSDSAGQFAKSKGKEREESGWTPTTPSKLPPPLLPPIELQPPSPPRRSTTKGNPDLSKAVEPTVLSSFETSALSPTSSSTSVFFTPTASPNKLSPGNRSPGTQQSASLGRSAVVGIGLGAKDGDSSSGDAIGGGAGGGPMRRNSLGDLKIPARISQAQVGLRRDLGMVREFATNVERTLLRRFPLISTDEYFCCRT